MKVSKALLPEELYVPTVDALYADARSLFVGSTSATVATLATALKAWDWTLLACALALFVIGAVRAFDMHAYNRLEPKPLSAATARRWEVRYMIGSAAVCALLGTWCFLAFTRSADPAVHLISFSVVIGYMVGITGRNFSSDLLVVIQTACVAVPMIAALLLQPNPYYHFLAVLLVPFFLSVRFISARLRQVLFDAVIGAHDVRLLAARFDAALTNMPHGLCMFDSDRRLVVSNGRFEELLGLCAEAERHGLAADDLLNECVAAGTLHRAHKELLLAELESAEGDEAATLATNTATERTLEFTFQPMANGGRLVLVEDITERRHAEAKIEYLARYDSLTELPNRTSFGEGTAQILAPGKRGKHALLFIDLDEFKQVNDTLGHPCGDALLCQVAERLRNVLRSSDLVARFGGDEFVVLQSRVRRRADVDLLAGRIVEALGEPYKINNHEIVISASIGIAMSPKDGVKPDQLLKRADIALYSAKAEGRGIWRYFERDMDVKAQERRTLEIDMREALATEAFEVRYQPIVSLRSGRVATCEALLRWPHPQRGMVSPAEFIPLAEEIGLIEDLGRWVLQQACRECASHWPPDVRVSVNLSPNQFRRSDVCTDIRQALKESGLAPDRLELEITESVLLEDTPAIRASLQQLLNLGVRISLDDFGTGYSSLSYLQSFPLHKVKVDRSFLAGVEGDSRSMTLLRGIARLSNELGMSVVVEGVETEKQLALLAAEETVAEVQGFLFSPAVPKDQIREMLGAEPRQMLNVA